MNKLLRPAEGRKIAGVCQALSQKFDIDVTYIRLLFIAATIFGAGWGVLFYLASWVAIPGEK